METIVGTTLVGMLVAGPLLWLRWQDARRERALEVRALVHAALCRRFRGEPLVSIEAEPAAPWRAGRVVLSAPIGWTWAIEAAWDSLMAEIPPGWDLVVRSGARPAPAAPAPAPALRRAA